MIVGPLVPDELVLVAISVLIANLTTRWIAPLALTVLAKSIQGAIVAIGALLVFPEYCMSRAHRRRDLRPPQLAYDYGAIVGWTVWHLSRAVGFLLPGLAKVLRTIPAIWITTGTALVTIGSFLNLISL